MAVYAYISVVIRSRWCKTKRFLSGGLFGCLYFLFLGLCGAAVQHWARYPLPERWDLAARDSAGAKGEGVDPVKERNGQGEENHWGGISMLSMFTHSIGLWIQYWVLGWLINVSSFVCKHCVDIVLMLLNIFFCLLILFIEREPVGFIELHILIYSINK